jgi:hypothetical protein
MPQDLSTIYRTWGRRWGSGIAEGHTGSQVTWPPRPIRDSTSVSWPVRVGPPKPPFPCEPTNPATDLSVYNDDVLRRVVGTRNSKLGTKARLDGEIGRRTGLKILWRVNLRAGSIPAPATLISKTYDELWWSHSWPIRRSVYLGTLRSARPDPGLYDADSTVL